MGTDLRGRQVSSLVNLSFVVKQKVLREQQLRTLCLENDLGKSKKDSDVRMSMSVPRVKEDRVGTG